MRRELGQHNLGVETLSCLARVFMARGERERAKTQIEEILRHLETGALDGTEDPLRIYLSCYHVLRANRDARAQDVLDTAHSLLHEQAAKIQDEDLRHSFLENVAANRAVLAEWAEQRTEN